MIAFWGGNVLALILLVVSGVLLARRARSATIAVPAVIAVIIGPTPFTRDLRISELGERPPPAAPGVRLRAISLPRGRMTFRIVGPALAALHENASKYYLRADLRQIWPPVHASAYVQPLCEPYIFNPCPPEVLLYPGGTTQERLTPYYSGGRSVPTPDPELHKSFPLSAIDVAEGHRQARVALSAPRPPTATKRTPSVPPRVVGVTPGPLRLSVFGLSVWLAATTLVLLAVRATRRAPARTEPAET